MKDCKEYQKIITGMVMKLKDVKKLERIYKLVMYLYTRTG